MCCGGAGLVAAVGGLGLSRKGMEGGRDWRVHQDLCSWCGVKLNRPPV